MQWSYDRDGNRIADGENGACDQWQKYSEQELRPNYKPAQTARVPCILAHPDCGLTIEVRMTMFDGAAHELDTVLYDQQRLMGDQWFGVIQFNDALQAEQRASAGATDALEAPDL